jgi:hypothetical protein
VTGLTPITPQASVVISPSQPGTVQIVNTPSLLGPEVENLTFYVDTVIVPMTGLARWYVYGGTYMVRSVWASLGVPPQGSEAIFDMRVNGASMLNKSGGDHRPKIQPGEFSSGPCDVSRVPLLGDGDYITADVVQAGSTYAGSTLTLNIRLSRTV